MLTSACFCNNTLIFDLCILELYSFFFFTHMIGTELVETFGFYYLLSIKTKGTCSCCI